MTEFLVSHGHSPVFRVVWGGGGNRLMMKYVLRLEWSLALTGTYRTACRQHDVSPFLINGDLVQDWPGLGQSLEQK